MKRTLSGLAFLAALAFGQEESSSSVYTLDIYFDQQEIKEWGEKRIEDYAESNEEIIHSFNKLTDELAKTVQKKGGDLMKALHHRDKLNKKVCSEVSDYLSENVFINDTPLGEIMDDFHEYMEEQYDPEADSLEAMFGLNKLHIVDEPIISSEPLTTKKACFAKKDSDEYKRVPCSEEPLGVTKFTMKFDKEAI